MMYVYIERNRPFLGLLLSENRVIIMREEVKMTETGL
jgi:hypothetical protein